MAELLSGLPPVVGPSPRILILGSFPGEESLRRQQYYAHPRNQFWPVMDALLGAGPQLAYRERLERLMASGIALWDVLATCRRPGSLDQRIERATAVPNDLNALVAEHPSLGLCCLNGSMAGSLYARLPAHLHPGLPAVVLPSTSPAHARLRTTEKIERWRAALAPVLETQSST